MKIMKLISLSVMITCLLLPTAQANYVRGIYLTQSTLQNTPKLNYLIRRAKTTGINTFVIDINRLTRQYQRNIGKVRANGITYVARIVVFPYGGKPSQVRSQQYWQKKYRLIEHAIRLGASEIQLDYIRYSAAQPKSRQNARDIHQVIRWYKRRLVKHNIPLQITVFGITSFGEAPHIGQNIKLFADSIDSLAPMLYPSHFEPYLHYATRPYETVFSALKAIKGQFYGLPFRLYPYIELFNYRYPLSRQAKYRYIHAQIKAAEDAGANGWYAWSANNLYGPLFFVLENYKVK